MDEGPEQSGGRNEPIAAPAISMAAGAMGSSMAISTPRLSTLRGNSTCIWIPGPELPLHAVPPVRNSTSLPAAATSRTPGPRRDCKPGLRRDVTTCESFHGNAPHPMTELIGFKLDGHAIRSPADLPYPALARGGVSTIVDWDWRTTGQKERRRL